MSVEIILYKVNNKGLVGYQKNGWMAGLQCIMHLSVFPPEVGGGITLGNLSILNIWDLNSVIPYPCDAILCQKSPGRAFRFSHNFFEIF